MGNSVPACDEELVRRLPLPLARLYRRAHNAKMPLERHLTAFYLWEASLKLLGSVAVVRYAAGTVHDPQLAERLHNLARPSLGHWWEFVRRLVPVLADQGDPAFAQLRDLLLGRTRADLPHTAGLDAALLEALEGKSGARSTVRLTELFDRLVRYRNQELGHGAAGCRSAEFYDRMGGAILAGVAEVLRQLDVLAGRRLLYVTEVRQAAGKWSLGRLDLTGETARQIEPLQVPRSRTAQLPDAERLYLDLPGQDGAELLLLHPLLIYEPAADEVLFLSARRGRQRSEYLCYSSGRTVDRAELGAEQRALLARVLNMPVEASQAEQWQLHSQAEEPPPAEPVQPARRQIGEFELLSELGLGGMGKVYRAWQPSLGRQVAVKELLRTGDPRSEARFAREIRALGRVEHANLVKIFTSGADGEHWFYAMELIEGAPLSAVCARLQNSSGGPASVEWKTWQETVSAVCQQTRESEKPLSGPQTRSLPPHAAGMSPLTETQLSSLSRGYVEQIVELVRQVARAAHSLHEAGVVHRDIKPGNIMVTADGGHAVLMDLGLAQLADEAEGRLTRTRQFVGTLRYASPQQVLAVAQLDRRTDVYSLGATLWELLTLKPLYGAGEHTPTPELMERIQHEEPGSTRRHNPRVPKDLDAIVQKCLEKNPAARYATALELADDLRRFQKGEPVRARPINRLNRTLRSIRRRPGKSIAWAAAVGLPLLCAAVALGIWDHWYRVKVEYYANTVRRWGVPEGIGRLTEEQVRHRGLSHKLTRRAGRVESVEAVNGFGNPVRSRTIARMGSEEFGSWWDYPTPEQVYRYEYQRNDHGQLLEEVARNLVGDVVWRLHYTSDSTAHYRDDQGFPTNRSTSGAVYVRFTWSPEGFEHEVRYLDRFGKPQTGRDGTFGKRTEFDARGLPVREVFLGPEGQPALHAEGFGRREMAYDEQGNVREQAWFDRQGQPTLCAFNTAREMYTYDTWGNRIRRAYFDRDGRPTLCTLRVARWDETYDDHGHSIASAWFGTDGQPTLNSNAVHRTTSVYDEHSNWIREDCFGLDGQPVLSTSCLYHRYKALFDCAVTRWSGPTSASTASRACTRTATSRK